MAQAKEREGGVTHLEPFQDGGAHALDLGHLVDLAPAHLDEALGLGGPQELLVEQLAVKVQPRAAHEPRHGRSARVVGKQCVLYTLGKRKKGKRKRSRTITQ